jgi:hypothetical protein
MNPDVGQGGTPDLSMNNPNPPDGGDPLDAADPVDAPPGDPDLAVDGAPPVNPVDAGTDGPAMTPFVCDPVKQTGCAPGQKCDLQAGTFACVADGPLGDFHVCDPAQQPCAAGFTCRETNYGDHRCARLCDGPASSLCVQGMCKQAPKQTSDGHTYFMCSAQNECSLLLQDCVSPSDDCAYTAGAGAFCLAPQTPQVADGEVCLASSYCARGSACLQGSDLKSRCRHLCDPAGGAPTCPTGVTCVKFTDIQGQPTGACGL